MSLPFHFHPLSLGHVPPFHLLSLLVPVSPLFYPLPLLAPVLSSLTVLRCTDRHEGNAGQVQLAARGHDAAVGEHDAVGPLRIALRRDMVKLQCRETKKKKKKK